MEDRLSFFITNLDAFVSLNHNSVWGMCSQQLIRDTATTHTNRKCLVIFVATFEQLVTAPDDGF